MKHEIITLAVKVHIWYDSPRERRYAIADAKENVTSVSNLRVAEPAKSRPRLFKSIKSS